MKIDELKGCFDSITPTKEQRDKMLAGIMRAKEEPVKVVKLNRYKYLSVAAVIALGVFVAVYSYIGNGIVPQVKTKDVVENTENSTIAIVNAPITEENAVVESTDSAVVTPSEETGENTDEGTFVEEMQEAYPEAENESLENTPSVAMFDAKGSERLAPAPESAEEDYMIDEEKYSGGAGGGGGGGSAGGGFPLYTIDIDLDYINNHEVFSKLFPTYSPDGFEFEYALKASPDKAESITADFVSSDGRRISVSIEKKDEFTFYSPVVTLEQINAMTYDGYSEFMVDCGDYYVEYFVYGEFDNSEEIYKMVKSSAYFK